MPAMRMKEGITANRSIRSHLPEDEKTKFTIYAMRIPKEFINVFNEAILPLIAAGAISDRYKGTIAEAPPTATPNSILNSNNIPIL